MVQKLGTLPPGELGTAVKTDLANTLLGTTQKFTQLRIHVLVALRIVQILVWPLGLLWGLSLGVANFPLAIAVCVVQTAWSLVWGTLLVSRRTAAPWMIYTDVGISAAAVVVAGLSCYSWDALSWANAAMAPLWGSALAAALFLPRRSAALSVAALGIGLVLAALPALNNGSKISLTLAANLLMLVIVSSLAGVVSGFLQQQSSLADKAGEQLAAAVTQSETSKAQQEGQKLERIKQYRTLHDTVLSTLSALARGSLDPSDPAVQRRCAADAEYLRSFINSDASGLVNRLQGELATVGREQGVLGIRVHQHAADLPAELPDDVVDALRDASREALNNVAKHSKSDQAWITALGEADGSVSVTIADRGQGFDPETAPAGMGLSQSIHARINEVGGNATIDSTPGQGTSVELRWPA